MLEHDSASRSPVSSVVWGFLTFSYAASRAEDPGLELKLTRSLYELVLLLRYKSKLPLLMAYSFFALREDNEERNNNSFYISKLYPLISDDKLDILCSGDPDRYLCIVLSAR